MNSPKLTLGIEQEKRIAELAVAFLLKTFQDPSLEKTVVIPAQALSNIKPAKVFMNELGEIVIEVP